MGATWSPAAQDDNGNTLEIFAFRATAATSPSFRFSFAPPSKLAPSSVQPCGAHPKRLRPLADVDGELSDGVQKKKRRLRLTFITSRLSRPFSAPPTHIVSRGSSKIAVWAKQKALGRSLLRKAAILNRIRRRTLSPNGLDLRALEWAPRQAFSYDYSATVVLDEELAENEARHHPFVHPDSGPRRQYLPPPSSPLTRDYGVFDNEDGFFDEEGEDGQSLIYSDFNILEPCEPVVGDHDALSGFDEKPPVWGRLVPVPDEKVIEIMEEKERQKEISFVRFEF